MYSQMVPPARLAVKQQRPEAKADARVCAGAWLNRQFRSTLFNALFNLLSLYILVYLMASDYDAKKYQFCAPWDGKRGHSFEKFTADFMAASAAKSDDDDAFDFKEHLLGTDAGGTNDAGVLNAHPGGATRPDSIKWHKQRGKQSFAAIRKHMLRDDIIRALDRLPVQYGRQAWKLLATYGEHHKTGILTLTYGGQMEFAWITQAWC